MKRQRLLALGLSIAAVTVITWGLFRYKAQPDAALKRVAQVSALKSPSVEERRRAAWDLVLSLNPDNRPAFQSAVDDPDLEVARTAVLGLGWLCPESVILGQDVPRMACDASGLGSARLSVGWLP